MTTSLSSTPPNAPLPLVPELPRAASDSSDAPSAPAWLEPLYKAVATAAALFLLVTVF